MPNIELKEIRKEKEKGRNCTLRIILLRHAHKAQFDPHMEGKISQSGLSEKGKTKSREYGRQIPAEDILKIHTSSFDRNLETAEHISWGSFDRESSPVSITTEVHNELAAPHFSKNFIEKEYRPRFNSKPNNFDFLSLDEQERIVEEIEEPAVDYWISLGDEKYDNETESAQEVAGRVAYYFITEPDKLIEDMQAGEKKEKLLGLTHKTATEPFLIYCIDPPVKNLRELGGSLNLLEGWTIEIKTDNKGKKSYKISIRDKEYNLNIQKINELAEEYKLKQSKKEK